MAGSPFYHRPSGCCGVPERELSSPVLLILSPKWVVGGQVLGFSQSGAVPGNKGSSTCLAWSHRNLSKVYKDKEWEEAHPQGI